MSTEESLVPHRFTNRVRRHPRVVEHVDADGTLILAAVDQLIVEGSAVDDVVQFLDQRSIRRTASTALTQAAESSHEEDVTIAERDAVDDFHILELDLTRESADDVFALTDELRAQGRFDPRLVSPNHVLVPAAWGVICPHGPPSPVVHVPPIPPRGGYQSVPITIIDSGYQWNALRWGNTNPLDALVSTPIKLFEADANVGGAWVPGLPDVPDADGDGVLDALAGHANFVAGLIARGCPQAEITIRNHNGGFGLPLSGFPNSIFGQIPLESAVMRSILKSVGAGVIHVGFAFPAYRMLLSLAWDWVFHQLPTAPAPIVVAPAGNQQDTWPRYPAAMNAAMPGTLLQAGRFPNVIGVGSIEPPGLDEQGEPTRSDFSNYGDWVTCAAIGTNVISTFLPVDLPLEEESGEDDPQKDPTARDFAQNAHAAWNGTSFAAPKIAAAVANRLGDPAALAKTPTDAWADLLAARGEGDAGLGMGPTFRR